MYIYILNIRFVFGLYRASGPEGPEKGKTHQQCLQNTRKTLSGLSRSHLGLHRGHSGLSRSHRVARNRSFGSHGDTDSLEVAYSGLPGDAYSFEIAYSALPATQFRSKSHIRSSRID